MSKERTRTKLCSPGRTLPVVVDLEHLDLELPLRLGVRFLELHLGQRELRIVVIFGVELVPLGVIAWTTDCQGLCFKQSRDHQRKVPQTSTSLGTKSRYMAITMNCFSLQTATKCTSPTFFCSMRGFLLLCDKEYEQGCRLSRFTITVIRIFLAPADQRISDKKVHSN
jgi:hypothetical protein